MFPFRPLILAAPAVITAADDADAANYFAALTTAPSNPERSKVNNTIRALKGPNLWAGLDWWVFLAAESNQAGRINAKKPAKSLTAVNGPTFTANVGWNGDRATSYLDMGETFQATGNQFAQNSHTIGAVVTAMSTFQGQTSLVGNIANNPRTSLAITSTSGGGYRAADANDGQFPQSSSRLGHFSFSRTAAASKRAYVNGTAVGELQVASTGLNTTNGMILGSRGAGCDDTLGIFYCGAGFTDSQMIQFNAIIRDNYLGPKGVMA